MKSMKIREYTDSWPPSIAIGMSVPDLDDKVISMRKYSAANDRVLLLNLVNKTGDAYGVPLVLPDIVMERAIEALTQKLPLTLQEVGELSI